MEIVLICCFSLYKRCTVNTFVMSYMHISNAEFFSFGDLSKFVNQCRVFKLLTYERIQISVIVYAVYACLSSIR